MAVPFSFDPDDDGPLVSVQATCSAVSAPPPNLYPIPETRILKFWSLTTNTPFSLSVVANIYRMLPKPPIPIPAVSILA